MANFDKFRQCFLIWMSLALDELKLGLLDYDKNHNHDYFGQYCNHDYLKRLLVGHMTNYMKDLFKDSDIYIKYIFSVNYVAMASIFKRPEKCHDSQSNQCY